MSTPAHEIVRHDTLALVTDPTGRLGLARDDQPVLWMTDEEWLWTVVCAASVARSELAKQSQKEEQP